MDMRKNITRFWSEVDDEKNRRILDACFHNFIFYITCAFSADYFFPFGISLILSILLTPLAQKLYKWINMTGIKDIPYDIPIIISFGIFIGIIYLIAIHIFVPFITELRAFTRSIPATFSVLQSAIPELEAAYH